MAPVASMEGAGPLFGKSFVAFAYGPGHRPITLIGISAPCDVARKQDVGDTQRQSEARNESVLYRWLSIRHT
jgi:hypothetical protein